MFELSVLVLHHKEISVRVKRKSGGSSKKSGGSSGKDKDGKSDSGKDGKKGSKGNNQLSTSVAEEMEFVQVFMSLNEEERALIGHDFVEFIKECTFRGHICGKHKKLVIYSA